MHRSNIEAYINVRYIIFDIIALSFSFFLSYDLTSFVISLKEITFYFGILFIYIPIFILAMSNFKMYDILSFKYTDRIIKNIFLSSFLAGTIFSASIYFMKIEHFSRRLLLIFLCLSFFLTIATRILIKYVQKNLLNNLKKKVLVVGDSNAIDKFEYFLDKTYANLDIVGYINLNGTELGNKNILGTIENFGDVLRNNVIDEVIFAASYKYIDLIENYLLKCEEMGITSSIVLDLYKLNFSRSLISSLGTLPILTFHTISLNRVQLLIKRTIDIIGSIIGLLITMIISVVIVPIIKLSSPGPILFIQKRIGKNGRVFNLYKFRTMYIDAEERKKELLAKNEMQSDLMFKIKDDPRITKIGKLLRSASIDELPQFINVLKGEMSLVGTRPPTLDEVSKYQDYHFRRLSTKPGITGMWQISGRNDIKDFDTVVGLDTMYIDNWSLFMDLKILLKTIFIVFKKTGAS